MSTKVSSTRWLVLGSGGTLGRRVVERLALLEQTTLALPHSQLDIASQVQVDDALDAFAPHIVVNAAAWTDVEGAEVNPRGADAANHIGVRNIATACKRTDARLIHVSTDYVFDGERDDAYDESDVDSLNPINEYGRSKLRGERAITSIMDVNYYVLRTAWLYDVIGRNFYTSILSKLTFTDDDVHVVCDQWGHPTPATRLAQLIVHLGHVEHQRTRSHVPFGTYHATSTDATTWYAFARMIAHVNDVNPERVKPTRTVNLPKNYRAHRPRRVELGQRKWRELDVRPFTSWVTELNLLVNDKLVIAQ